MDVEGRLLLYAVVLGALVGVFTLVRRRAWVFKVHLVVLLALLGVSGLALARAAIPLPPGDPGPSVPPGLAGYVFAAFTALVLLPSMLLVAARSGMRSRQFGVARYAAGIAAALLGWPPPIRGEALLYAALDAGERGDEAGCADYMKRLAEAGSLPAYAGGSVLAELLPLARARRWAEVLRVVDRSQSRGAAVLVIEARAAAETGALRRAVDACEALAVTAPPGGAPLAQARRAALAAAGRVEFLERASEQRLPVMALGGTAAELAVARALEARGDTDVAAARFRALVTRLRGSAARDAEQGLARCEAGEPLLAVVDEDLERRLDDIEASCRSQEPAAPTVPWYYVARATLALSVLTIIASVLAWTLGGTDIFSLITVGALSAPLIAQDGEWWRLATTMWLHVGVVHLLFNIGSVLVVGVPLEKRIGVARILAVYFASGWLGSVASVWIQETPVGVGASGAAMGLLGALLALALLRPEHFEGVSRRRWLNLLWITIIATAGLSFLEWSSIDHAAHGAGMVAGFVVMVVLLPGRQPPAQPAVLARALAALLVAAQIVCTAAALAEVPAWRGWQEVRGGGAAARVPSWLKVETTATRGVLGERAPLDVYVQIGAFPLARPDPIEIVGSPLMQALLSQPPTSAEIRSLRDLAEEDELYRQAGPANAGEGEPMSLRLLRMTRGRAFAVVVMPDDPDAREQLEPMLNELRASLRVDE